MYKPTIGLEIHVELSTKSKMFCSCLNDPDERKPNTNVCPVCMGHPGTLPVINEEAVRKVIKTGLALDCHICEDSKFDRKNYFYPDLPKGYQISQYDKPFCLAGSLKVEGKKIRIKRVHLEEDTGKLLHPAGENYSLVDFNRAGVPLMELVTEPDMSSAKEAREFAQELHLLMHYLNVSDADMEKGQMRVEVNISLSKDEKFGTKVEIKNINSFRSVEKAIDFEIKRQAEELDEGKKIVQETRGWNDARGTTVSQREKEEAHDYRYFPEPDLPALKTSVELVNGIKSEIPELPRQKRERLRKEYGLEKELAEIFVYDKAFGEYFEKVVSEFGSNLPKEELFCSIKLATNYLTSDLKGLLGEKSVLGKDFMITPVHFAEFIALIYQGKISSKIAKVVLAEMFKTGASSLNIIRDKGLNQITDESEIEKAAKEVISSNPNAVNEYKKGKANALQFLVGQVMAKTRGKANPQIVNNLLRKLLTR